MKKTAKKRTGESANTAAAVEQYIARAPERARKMLAELRETIRFAVPPDTTEVISYKIPAFKRDRILVWYAAFSDHCSLFPTSSVIGKFKAELKDYKTSKGTIQFPLDKPLPRALVGKIVKTRVAEAGR